MEGIEFGTQMGSESAQDGFIVCGKLDRVKLCIYPCVDLVVIVVLLDSQGAFLVALTGLSRIRGLGLEQRWTECVRCDVTIMRVKLESYRSGIQFFIKLVNQLA